MSGPHFLMSDIRCRAHPAKDEQCFFQVSWSINPHMQPEKPIDIVLAERQHRGLRHALVDAGADVTVVPFVHGAYDSVFMKDNALLVEDRRGRHRALLARPRFPERAKEQAARERALDALGFAVEHSDQPSLEGGDIVLLPHARGALLGHGFRSSAASTYALASFLETRVTPLELVDEALYHLDMAVSVLADGTALVCKAALSPASFRALVTLPSIRRVVDVPREEALAFALNLIEVDETVIVAAGNHDMAARLGALGKLVVEVPLGELQRAGGSAACLVARVHDLPLRAPDVAVPRLPSGRTAVPGGVVP